MQAKVIRRKEGINLNFGASTGFIKEDGNLTRNLINFMEVEGLPGSHLPPQHIHNGFEELFYILEGEIEFKVGNDVITASVGDFVTVPSGVSHTYGNSSSKLARLLIIHTDGRMAEFFQEVDSSIKQGIPTSQAIAQLMTKYDTEPVP